jgi:PPOX class probable F420-dependent enzyme
VPESRPSRGATPSLTPDEVAELLHLPGQRMVVATILPDGLPHVTVVWYGFAPDGRIAFTVPSRSQKARNLARDPRITLLVDGGQRHGELHGVQIAGHAELRDDHDSKLAIHRSIAQRYATRPSGDLDRTMARRVAVLVTPGRTRSWDHRKLPARPAPAGATASEEPTR